MSSSFKTNPSQTKKGSFKVAVKIGPKPNFEKLIPLSQLSAYPIDVSTETEVLRLHPVVYALIMPLSFNTLKGKIPCSSKVPNSPSDITCFSECLIIFENPLSKSRIKNLINNAKYMLGDLPEHEDEWLGFRPSLPDFLPVMGPSKNHKNVFYCFGHHHLGWTLGPISGKIVSGMVANENTNLDLKPYSSLRFS